MRRKSIFLLALLFGVTAAFAQNSEKSLKEALNLLTKEKKTRFIFERSVVEGLRVNYNWNDLKEKKAQDVLNELLSQVGLYSLPVGNNYFAIKKNKKPADDKSVTILQVTPPPSASQLRDSSRAGRSIAVVVVSGVVRERGTRKPVEGATLQLEPYGLYAISDKNGSFSIKNVPVSRVRLTVSGLSMVSEERMLDLEQVNDRFQAFYLTANALGLKEVVVVAKENKQGSTSSIISKTAIEHLQAVSLSDIMQLLPGGLANNPNLNDVNRFSIRQVISNDVTASVIGSLGTSLMVNGAPVSNNANLQAMNTSTGGFNAGFSTSSGAGVDFRQFSTDNIESLEVIRGVPSVEHGDLSGGAIILKTKAGVSPFQLKARINPRLTQFSGSKGFAIGRHGGAMHANLDYTRSFDDQRFEYKGYHRITGGLLYSKTFGKRQPFSTNTGLNYSMNLDEQKLDPDDKRYQTVTKAQDYNFRFTSDGKWELGKKFARELQYTLSASYSRQKGYQQGLYSGAIYPLSYATENVTLEGQFVPSEYLSRLWIDGEPINLFAKITNSFFHHGNWLNHKVLMGAEWKTDMNNGAGKTYDLSRPPRMQSGNGMRPRSYSDIPALNQLSFYAEDMMVADVLGKRMTLQAGIRFDNIQPTGIWTSKKNTVAAPRLNWSYELLRDFTIRAGWGITAKAPSLLYLYPQNAYFDMINFNRYSSNPNESLVYITTRVFNSENPDLKVMKTNKSEVGFDWSFGANKKKRLTVTGFYEKTNNGYSFDKNFESVKIVPLQIYDTISTSPGQKPVVDFNTDSILNFIADYNMPINNYIITNKGIEFDLDLGRFDAIRTQFILNGAYMKTTAVTSQNTIMKKQIAGRDPDRIAVYDKGRGTEAERFSTALRVVHNIPELRLAITFTAQTIWSERERNIGYDSLPIGYISRSNGQYNLLSKADRDAISNAPLGDKNRLELLENFSEGYFRVEKWNPLWLFNLRLQKDIGKGLSFAFFANNVFSHQPLQRNTRYTNTYERRNPDLFFGTEVTVKF